LLAIVGASNRVHLFGDALQIEAHELGVCRVVVQPEVDRRPGSLDRTPNLGKKLGQRVGSELQKGVQLGYFGEERRAGGAAVPEQVQLERLAGVEAIVAVGDPAESRGKRTPVDTSRLRRASTVVAKAAPEGDAG